MAIEFEGLEGILRRFDKVKNVEGVKKALNEACLLVEESAVKKAPKETGELQRSITSKVEDLKGIVYSPFEYAPYVEYGTGLFSSHPKGGRKDVPWVYKDEKTGEFISTYGQHPHPFMIPALEENRDNIIEIIKGGLIEND